MISSRGTFLIPTLLAFTFIALSPADLYSRGKKGPSEVEEYDAEWDERSDEYFEEEEFVEEDEVQVQEEVSELETVEPSPEPEPAVEKAVKKPPPKEKPAPIIRKGAPVRKKKKASRQVKKSAAPVEKLMKELPPETIVEETIPVVAPGAQIYSVWVWQETRDSLWNLADTYYGDPWQWKKIYLANRNTILDPSLIYPKQKIIIP